MKFILCFQILRQPLNYVIVNLAVADLLAGVVGGVPSIFANAHGYFYMGKSMCEFEGYMVSNFGECLSYLQSYHQK